MTHKHVTHEEIHEQLTDFVLDLLAPRQAEEIAEHLAECAACRKTVLREREIGALVRSTLIASTHPDAARLRQLMPPVPQQKRKSRGRTIWEVRLAPALVVVAIILGSFLISAPDSERPMPLFGGVTATATSTNTPTATIARHIERADAQTAVDAVDNSLAVPISVIESPAPEVAVPAPHQSPTPVAASSQTAAN